MPPSVLWTIAIGAEPDEFRFCGGKVDIADAVPGYVVRRGWSHRSDPIRFALDEAHGPHISLLQCFMPSQDLDKVYAAISKVLDGGKRDFHEPWRASGGDCQISFAPAEGHYWRDSVAPKAASSPLTGRELNRDL